MSEEQNSLDEIREILGQSDEQGSSCPTWPIVEPIGCVERFNGKQKLIGDIVGMGPLPNQIQITTTDTWDEVTRVSRWLVIANQQAPEILKGIHQAEIRIANLEATDPDAWPEMPLVVTEGMGGKNAVKVFVDFYKDNLEIKVAKANGSSRTSGWAKWGIRDNRAMMRMILNGYDAIVAAQNVDEPGKDPSGENDLF